MVTTLLVGAGILFWGIILGRMIPNRGPKPPRSPRPICGCKHHFSFHDGEGCHFESRVPASLNKYGEVSSYRMVRCQCRRLVAIDAVIVPTFEEDIPLLPPNLTKKEVT